MKRVLLPLHGYIGWNGGLDLVRLLISAMRSETAATKIDLHIAFPKPTATQRLLLATLRHWREWLAGTPPESAGNQSGLRKTAEDLVSGLSIHSCTNDSNGILSAAIECNADIVFPTMHPLGRHAKIKRIGYIFDFQHRYIPELFSSRAQRNRDRQFSRIANDSNGIVVNSRMVARDVARFLNVKEDAILAMPFTPYALPWWFDSDIATTQMRYGIVGPYILICNHFWKHKDHATAFRAFAQLNHTHQDLHLVMTGDPIDHREPQHFGQLISLAKSLGITDRLHFLGLIPKAHQLALLRGCRLLVQPTLFEGGPGGGSVYEAIGMNIPAIVSDIVVNREADFGPISFFRAGDVNELANAISDRLAAPLPASSPDDCAKNGRLRLEHLGLEIDGYLSRILQIGQK
ncbi:glycosyltransferase [Rhodanobacter sp. DHB23]|uniref:glycosyltransferase n=1 Tax=Rhodanobacter sp. DHB23 TaxID=2775923 RepID=UPI00177ADE55|nr:glycosyltransferase [Rhodanobacter sp. DHB23]MBD8873124.1 glycosyltransferase [Rhodanobacter sp. DHB23]